MSPTVRPVILSGGAGTRLWPLSTEDRPKQFLGLLGETLFELALRRLEAIDGLAPATVVTRREHLELVNASSRASGVALGRVVVEPVGRNTAAAVIAAALLSDPEDVLIVLPSDHLISDLQRFRTAVGDAIALARDGYLVTFGAAPTRPEIGYGYIESGPRVGAGFRVARFKEKPDIEEAARLHADGRHYWNSGMFVFTAAGILAEGRRSSPEIVSGVESALPEQRNGTIHLGESFAGVPSVSIDHAIMERTSKAAVIPIDVGWSDVGSWESLWEHSERDMSGNVITGDVVVTEVTNSYVHSSSRMVAVPGVDGLVVVETPDAVLVSPKDRSQLVKDLAASPAEAPATD